MHLSIKNKNSSMFGFHWDICQKIVVMHLLFAWINVWVESVNVYAFFEPKNSLIIDTQSVDSSKYRLKFESCQKFGMKNLLYVYHLKNRHVCICRNWNVFEQYTKFKNAFSTIDSTNFVWRLNELIEFPFQHTFNIVFLERSFIKIIQ